MSVVKAQLLPLTGMRCFLALWVVAFHQPFFTGFAWMSRFPEPIPSLIHTGYVAVGVFFALSGFVLSYSYSLAEPWSVPSWKRFAVARFARIYPAYGVGLVLSAPWVAAYIAQRFSVRTVSYESVKAGLTWTLLQAWLPGTANAWNNPAWSLSVEAFFYCCFPLVGVALWRLSSPSRLIAGGVVLWAAALLGPLIALTVPFTDAGGVPAALWTRDSAGLWVNFLKFNPLLHLPQFCTGIVLGRTYYLLRARNSRLMGRGYYFYVPAILIEVLFLIQYRSTLYPFLHNGLLLPVHALIILGLALDGGFLARFLSLPPMVLLGNASYSMYLFHGVLADWMSLIAKRFLSRQFMGFQITIVYVALLVCFSVAVYKFIEQPANRFLKKYFASWSHAKAERIPGAVASASC